MKILKMKNGFNRMSDADLNHKAGIILQPMTDNPNFPSPSPTLAQVTDTLNAYSAAVLKAMDKGLQKITEKNQLKALLVGQLHNLANYVVFCAAGNVAIATNSGFTVSPPRGARPPLTKPSELRLTNGINRGELLLRLKLVPNVQSYRYEITPHPYTAESHWETFTSTVSKKLLTVW